MKPTGLAKALAVVVCVLALNGCVLPASPPGADFNAFVSDPPNGAVVQLGTAINLAAQAYSYVDGRGVTSLIFYANGGPLGESATLFPFAADSWAGELSWTPPAVGEYLVQVQAVHRGGSYVSDPVRVCVVDFLIAPGSSQAASGYEGPCPIPDRDASARPGALVFAAEAMPDSLGYPATSGPEIPSCPSPTLSFQATVVDPPEDVAFVTVSVSVPAGPHADPSYPPGSSLDTALVLTQTASFAGSTRIFTGSTGPIFAVGLTSHFADLGGNVTWTARAIGRDGSILLTDGPYTIPASPCSALPLSAPFTPPAPTSTPASARDCPAGTYFAEITHQCIPVQVRPTKSGGANCAQYTTDSACNAAPGCAYDYVAKKCKAQ